MNIEPFQKDFARKIFSTVLQQYHSSKQFQTVPENQISSSELSSDHDQFFVSLEIDKVLDKIQL